MTVKEAAKIWGRPPSTVRYWIQREWLDAETTGGRRPHYLIREDALIRALEKAKFSREYIAEVRARIDAFYAACA